jgi:hypothetical protein
MMPAAPDVAFDEFARAFVAVSYLLGVRGSELVDALAPAPHVAVDLAASLSRLERTDRAKLLARELAPITLALRARSL